MVRARPDGADDLLGLGRGEDELHVGRRLLHDLQQGVEALRRDHVGLVDDVDLVAAVHGGEEGPLTQVTRLVHAAVAGRVDLDDVDAARTPAREVDARPARATGGGRGALLAVQAPGEDACRGRLAAAARAAEQVGVVDPVVGERPLQRLGDMLLPDDLVEGVGAVAAVEGQRGILRRLGARDRRGTHRLGSGRWCQRGGYLSDRGVGLGLIRLLDVFIRLRIDRNLGHLVLGQVHLRVVGRGRLGGQDQLVRLGAEQVRAVLRVGVRAVVDGHVLVVEEATHEIFCHAPHPTGSP